MKKFLLVLFILPLLTLKGYAQVASISYTSPQTYSAGAAIAPLSPANTGGTVPNFLYSQVTTFASGFNMPAGLATDASGNIYVADAANSVIRKITPAGVMSVFAGTVGTTGSGNGTGTGATFNNPTGVAVDPSGNVYVADSYNNMIRKITPAGVVTTFAGNIGGGANDGVGTLASFNTPYGVATDASGNIYVADSENNLIRMITPAGVVTLLAGDRDGSDVTYSGSADGVGAAASFYTPNGLIADGAGNLYVADQGNNLIRKIAISSATVSTLAGGNSPGQDGTGAQAGFNAPYAVAVDAQGNVYVADAYDFVIRAITPAGVVTTLAGTDYTNGAQDGIGTAATFYEPTGLAINAQGELYISDTGNNLIRKLETLGFIISPTLPPGLAMAGTGIISGTPTAPSPSTDYTVTAYNTSGASTPAIVNITVLDATLSKLTTSTGTLNPAFSPASTVYVINVPYTTTNISVTPTVGQSTSTIKVNGATVLSGSASGSLNLAAGSNSISIVINAKDGSSTTYQVYVVRAQPATPVPSITYASPQTYFVGTAIASLSPANTGGAVPANTYQLVTTFAGNGNAGAANLTGVNATFNAPTGVATDLQGNVYVADQMNNLIRKITPAGVVTTLAGGGAVQGQDGTGTAASFNSPDGVATDAQGNVYVADFGDSKIRMITPAGVVTTLAGSPENAGGYADGPVATALFNQPTGVAVDLYNNVYVADYGNNMIRKISPEGVVSTLAGNGSVGAVNGTGAANTSFSAPWGIGTDGQGNIYVADAGNNMIRKITPAGVVTTLAGSGVAGYLGGAPTTAQFNNPEGVIVTPQGNVYVADAGNGQVRKVTAAGVVSTFAGSGNFTFVNGIGTKASFNGVTGLALDAQENLYAADIGDNAIREISTTGYIINPTLPTGLSMDPTTGIITGTPTVPTALQNYSVTAYNAGGNNTFKIGIQVITPSTDANLSNLTLSQGTLSPAFVQAGTSYTAVVSAATTSITVTPTTDNAAATMTVDGVSLASGTASAPIALTTGANTITVVVTAQNGTSTMTYTVVVTRGPSTTDNLSNLVLTTATLSPAFATATTTYTATVSNLTTSISVTPTTTSTTETVTVNGTAVNSGAASGLITLAVGPNTITTIATAQDGTTTKTYTVTVTRNAATGSSNANLSNLTASNGTLSPAFATATTSYTVSVPGTTNTISFTPTTADATASVTVNGIAVPSGSASGAITLPAGATTSIPVSVTAQNGTQITYTVNVTRAQSANNNLSNLTISDGALNPPFAPATTNYSVSVVNATSSVTLTATTADATATITINGTAVTSGSTSSAITLPVGLTNIPVVVTAQNGASQTYTVSVTRAGSSNANLSDLTISTGTLSPGFASSTLNYSTAVSNNTTSITLTPTVADPTATITVNSVAVASGTASGPVTLNVGANTINTIVTAQDGSTQITYTVTVTRAAPPSTNSLLANISLSSGALNPAFASGTTNYTATVTGATNTITLTPATADGTATVTVNGVPVNSGSASASIPLNIGVTNITTVVTAQDGVTQTTYTVAVTRLSADADLSNLSLSAGTLSPAFAAATITYSASVGNTTTSITVTPTVADPNASVTINGAPVASGSASGSIALAEGANTVSAVVTAQDGTTKTYTVTVNRAAATLSTNAFLSNLTLSTGDALSPVFATATYAYTATVSNATASIMLTPTTADANATVTVNGNQVTSGSQSGAITLSVGSNNVVTINVTAQDGVTTQAYTVTITRQSSNDNLSGLGLSSGTLSPVFAATTTAYNVAVSNTVTSISVTPTTTDGTATVTVNGFTVASGSASAGVPIAVGTNTITTTVTAQDGSTKTYTVTVTRAAATLSTNAYLSNLTISNGTLTPVFAAGTFAYTASVSNATASVTLTPLTSDPNATVTINGIATTSGSPSGAIALNVGQNVITVIVTAQDGATTQTYTVTVTRLSADADLSNLSLSSGTLSPVFAAATITYAATVSNTTANITVTPTTADATATVTVNGIAVTSGSPSGSIALATGANNITVIVTAQDNSTKTYTVSVTRAAAAQSTNASLARLTISNGTLSPAFATGTNAYTTTVSNLTTVITVTPTTADPTATVTVNGTAVTSGSASGLINLQVGTNTITTTVTAQDGATTQTYTIVVTRLSADADLSGITLSSGTLSPVFAQGVTAYSAVVSNATTEVTLTPVTDDVNATVTVNGSVVASGSASPDIALPVGTTAITTIVTAQDGTTKTYTVSVTRANPALSTNAALSNLGISIGTLAPVFNSNSLNYTVAEISSVTSITITPATADANATVTVNGTAVSSGSASAPIALNIGANTIAVTVTAADGATKQTYNITVTRAASSNAGLSNIVLSSGTLTPVFATGTAGYTASVSNAITSITLTPTLADVNASVTVNGIAVTSGTASGPIGLNVGANTITSVVTAQDGVTQLTYTITVTRAPSADADLANLTTNYGTLSPGFAPGTIAYSVSVNNSVNTITLLPTTADANATVTVNGTTIANGSSTAPILLNVGSNTITIVVTAQDGVTAKTYTVTVTRATLASDATLSSLTTSSGTLAPVFSPTDANYTVLVPYSIKNISVTPTTNSPYATVTVNSTTITSGSASSPIALNVGSVLITIIVKAQDGVTVETYTIIVTRATPSFNANLASLSLSSGTLAPAFSTAVFAYGAEVITSTNSITLTPTVADTTATVTVNGTPVTSGTPSGPVNLNVGLNLITVFVTAQNGVNSNSYTVNVKRDSPNQSSNDSLSSIGLSAGTLQPVFDPGTLTYTTTVTNETPAITITPVTTDTTATVTVNGEPVANGTASIPVNLAVGANTIIITVTAQNGSSVKTYIITVTRGPYVVSVPNAFTPNGDGINDTWVIKNINIFPDCTVKVFNRGGQLVFSSTGYGTAWDGTLNGAALPSGTYYYIIDLKTKGKMSGALILIR